VGLLHLIRQCYLGQVFALGGFGSYHEIARLKNKDFIGLLGQPIDDTSTQVIHLHVNEPNIVSGFAHNVAEPALQILVLSLDLQESYLVVVGEQKRCRLLLERGDALVGLLFLESGAFAQILAEADNGLKLELSIQLSETSFGVQHNKLKHAIVIVDVSLLVGAVLGITDE